MGFKDLQPPDLTGIRCPIGVRVEFDDPLLRLWLAPDFDWAPPHRLRNYVTHDEWLFAVHLAENSNQA